MGWNSRSCESQAGNSGCAAFSSSSVLGLANQPHGSPAHAAAGHISHPCRQLHLARSALPSRSRSKRCLLMTQASQC